ncbi:SLC13 family permease [Nocardioides sp. NPDC087217]|uniref:SLC13 family permease n=1 Tax=Nocardioides sp. NPDC087217 TaxID=3364335 RepID=UPI00381F1F72
MELIGILVLAAVFLLGTVRGVNMGTLALAAAFATGAIVYDRAPEDILAGFPASLLVVLVGVTFLFGIARVNGTIDWIVAAALHLVGNRVALIPWVLFAVAVGLTAAGAASPAAVAIVAPIGIAFGMRYVLSPLYLGLMVVNGAAAGSYAPTGILGGIVNGTMDAAGIDIDTGALFIGNLAFGLLVCVVTWLVFGRRPFEPTEIPGTQRGAGPHAVTTTSPGISAGGSISATAVHAEPHVQHRLQPEQAMTLAGIATLVIGSTVFALDTGFLALTVAAVLAVIRPESGAAGAKEIAWPVILLVCGIVTYVTMLDAVGVVDWLGENVAAVGVPLVAALLILYMGGVVSAFASTTGILAVLAPLAVPLLESGNLAATSFVIALTVSATVVDASPFSTNGALVVANSPAVVQAKIYRSLLLWGVGMTLAAPLLAWLAFVVV